MTQATHACRRDTFWRGVADWVGLMFGSVLLLSSAWPLGKIVVTAGAGPLSFAEGRAVLSGIAATLPLAIRGGLKRSTRRAR